MAPKARRAPGRGLHHDFVERHQGRCSPGAAAPFEEEKEEVGDEENPHHPEDPHHQGQGVGRRRGGDPALIQVTSVTTVGMEVLRAGAGKHIIMMRIWKRSVGLEILPIGGLLL